MRLRIRMNPHQSFNPNESEGEILRIEYSAYITLTSNSFGLRSSFGLIRIGSLELSLIDSDWILVTIKNLGLTRIETDWFSTELHQTRLKTSFGLIRIGAEKDFGMNRNEFQSKTFTRAIVILGLPSPSRKTLHNTASVTKSICAPSVRQQISRVSRSKCIQFDWVTDVWVSVRSSRPYKNIRFWRSDTYPNISYPMSVWMPYITGSNERVCACALGDDSK